MALLGIEDRYGDLVDFVAWQLSEPGCWWLRRGESILLGAQNLETATEENGWVKLFSTPETWAINGGRGVCILNWEADIGPIFDDFLEIECDTEFLRARFDRALRQRAIPRVSYYA